MVLNLTGQSLLYANVHVTEEIKEKTSERKEKKRKKDKKEKDRVKENDERRPRRQEIFIYLLNKRVPEGI